MVVSPISHRIRWCLMTEGLRVELTILLTLDELLILRQYAEKIRSDAHWGGCGSKKPSHAEVRLANKLKSILSEDVPNEEEKRDE